MLKQILNFKDNRRLHRQVLNLTWPVIIANLSLPLAGAVDTAVVGHLPDPVYIGAVALGALIFSTLYWLVGFLRMGTTGFVAQSYGADDYPEIVAVFLRSLVIAAGFGGLIIAVQVPIGQTVFWFFEATELVETSALEYYRIRIWGAIFAMFNLVVLGMLFGLQRMKTALGLQLLLNGMNIVLDLLFVVVFGWGVSGVAVATVISETITALMGLVICWQLLQNSAAPVTWSNVFRRAKMVQLVQVNVNILIRSLCLEVVIIYFMWASAGQGDIVLAGNSVLLHLLHFLAFGLDGFAHSAEALAGNAYGARDRRRLNRIVAATLMWSCIMAIGFSLIYALLGDWIIGLMTGIDSVRETAGNYLIWMIIAPFFCVWPFLYDGVYIGMTRTVEMRNCLMIAMVLFFLAVLPSAHYFGNHGLWMGIMVFMLARGLLLAVWYRKIAAQVPDSA